MNSATLRVLIVASPRFVRESLARTLRATGEFEVYVSTPTLVVRSLDRRDRNIDIVVVAVDTPEAAATLPQLAAAEPGRPIVGLGAYPRAATEFRALARFVGLGASQKAVTQVIREAATGGRRRREDQSRFPQPAGSALRDRELDTLSPREREILSLLERGLSNRLIGDTLFISISTVKNHVHRILQKLGVRSRGEAVARVCGWRPLSDRPGSRSAR